jgi:hypothetical protein
VRQRARPAKEAPLLAGLLLRGLEGSSAWSPRACSSACSRRSRTPLRLALVIG